MARVNRLDEICVLRVIGDEVGHKAAVVRQGHAHGPDIVESASGEGGTDASPPKLRLDDRV
jgi:hypothetical protein